jgi:SAM-dependent methyltransferase
VQSLGEELRDERLPALDGRVSALVERLHEELTATAGVVDRLCRHEPLHVAVSSEVEGRLPEAIRAASRLFIDEFRGTPVEVSARLEEYLPILSEAGPVLDLGCGRGELLGLLQRQGILARGVDTDPAMVATCGELGLEVQEADANEALRAAQPDSLGAVVAIQLLEHLQSASWMELVENAARALRKGGLLLVECPNPGSLRVGGSLFWLDPTHRAPVHPEALAFVARVLGRAPGRLALGTPRLPPARPQALASEGR